jgi:hypothetical protein
MPPAFSAMLPPRIEVFDVYLADTVHPIRADDDAALDGHRAARVADAAAARRHGESPLVRQTQDGRDLRGVAGQHDGLRRKLLLQRVARVRLDPLRVNQDVLRADNLRETREHTGLRRGGARTRTLVCKVNRTAHPYRRFAPSVTILTCPSRLINTTD